MRLSQVFDLNPEYVSQLEKENIHTLQDLGNISDLKKLSARTHIHLDVLKQWRKRAQDRVTSGRHRAKAIAVLSVVTVMLLSAIAVWAHKNGLSPSLDEAVDVYNAGNALYEKREYFPAVIEFKKAVALRPNYAAAHNNLGAALDATGDHAAAIIEFKEALRLNPKGTAAKPSRRDILQPRHLVHEHKGVQRSHHCL